MCWVAEGAFMINDATTLRFSNGDGSTPYVTVGALAHLVMQIEMLFREATSEAGPFLIETHIVASPRAGSLNIFIKPNIVVVADPPSQIRPKARFKGDDVTTYALIWTIIMGQNGVYDVLRNHAAPFRSHDEAGNNNVAQLLVSAKVQNEIINNLTIQVNEAAARCGAEKVEIILPDQAAVPLYESGERRQRSLIGRRVTSRNSTLPPEFRRSEGDTLDVLYEGQELTAFTAEGSNGHRYVILWKSRKSMPAVDARVIVGESVLLSLSDILPQGPIPSQFEAAGTIVLVKTAATEFD